MKFTIPKHVRDQLDERDAHLDCYTTAEDMLIGADDDLYLTEDEIKRIIAEGDKEMAYYEGEDEP